MGATEKHLLLLDGLVLVVVLPCISLQEGVNMCEAMCTVSQPSRCQQIAALRTWLRRNLESMLHFREITENGESISAIVCRKRAQGEPPPPQPSAKSVLP